MKKKRKAKVKKKVVKRKRITAPKKAEQKKGLMVVQSAADPRINIVMATELMDDQMIEAELMHEVVPFYIYRFNQDGKEIVGLSAKGVNEVVRLVNKNPRSGARLRVAPDSMKIEQNVDVDGVRGVQATVLAQDLISGATAWGVKFEAYRKKRSEKKGGGSYENTFATEKAITKAERNAKRKLIAEPLAIKMIQKIMNEQPSMVRTIAPTDVKNLRRDLPAAKTESQMTKTDRMRMTTDAIRDCNEVKTLEQWRGRINNNKELDNQEKIKLMGLINDRIKALKK